MRSKIAKNISYSGAVTLVCPAIQLLATPILFHGLGATCFGIWAVVNAIVAASGVAGLGLGDAATKFVAQMSCDQDRRPLHLMIRTLIALYVAAGALAGLILFFAAYPIASLLNKGTSGDFEVTVCALRIASFGLLARFVYGIFEAIVRGFVRYDLESICAIANTAISTLSAVILVRSGYGLQGVLVASVIALIGCSIVLGLFARKLVGGGQYLLPYLDGSSARKALSFSAFTWVQSINGIVLFQLDRLLLASLAGPLSVGYYSVCLQVVQTGLSIVSRGSGVVFPIAVTLLAEGKKSALASVFISGMIWSTFIGWAFSATLLIFGSTILQVWMGQGFADASRSTLWILAIWSAMAASSQVPYNLLNASGNERANTALGVASSLLVVATGAIAIPFLGPLGAALGRMSTVLISLYSRYLVMRRLFGVRNVLYGVATFFPVLGGIAVVLLMPTATIAYKLSHYFVNFASLCVSIGVCWLTARLVYRRILATLAE